MLMEISSLDILPVVSNGFGLDGFAASLGKTVQIDGNSTTAA